MRITEPVTNCLMRAFIEFRTSCTLCETCISFLPCIITTSRFIHSSDKSHYYNLVWGLRRELSRYVEAETVRDELVYLTNSGERVGPTLAPLWCYKVWIFPCTMLSCIHLCTLLLASSSDIRRHLINDILCSSQVLLAAVRQFDSHEWAHVVEQSPILWEFRNPFTFILALSPSFCYFPCILTHSSLTYGCTLPCIWMHHPLHTYTFLHYIRMHPPMHVDAPFLTYGCTLPCMWMHPPPLFCIYTNELPSLHLHIPFSADEIVCGMTY